MLGELHHRRKRDQGREEKGDGKDCVTCSNSAVTFQLPLKPHLTKKKKTIE